MKLIGTVKSDLDVRKAVLDMVQKDNQIIHGARATNKQLPINLRKETEDYDIYTKQPQKAAERLARVLNAEFGEGYSVVPGRHKGTFKVKSSTGKTIADYTQVTKRPKAVNKFGVKYADVSYAKRKLQKLVRDERTAFRRDKDMETLQRIKQGTRRFDF